MTAVSAAALLSLFVHAGPPKALTELAAAIDGARRADGKKECSFAVEKVDCALAVRVSCTSALMKYAYVMTLPLGKLDPKKSVYEPNAGGFPGAHGVELNATGDVIETVTDDGQKTSGATVVLAFGNTPDDEQRAKKLLASLPAAKKACR